MRTVVVAGWITGLQVVCSHLNIHAAPSCVGRARSSDGQISNQISNHETTKKALANIFQFYWFRTMVTIGISIFGAALLRALISPFKTSP